MQKLQELRQGHEGRPGPDQQQGVGGEGSQEALLEAGALKLQGSWVEGVQAPLELQGQAHRGLLQPCQVLPAVPWPFELLRRTEKTTPSSLPTGRKLQGSPVQTRYVSAELSRRGRLNLSMSICHVFNPPDVCLQT